MNLTMTVFAIHNWIKYLYPLKIQKPLILLFYSFVIGYNVSVMVYNTGLVMHPYCLPDKDISFAMWMILKFSTFFEYGVFAVNGLMFYQLSLCIRVVAGEIKADSMKCMLICAYMIVIILVSIDIALEELFIFSIPPILNVIYFTAMVCYLRVQINKFGEKGLQSEIKSINR